MIEKYLGIESDYLIIGLAALSIILFILWIVNIIQIEKLKKNYKIFMGGKDAKALEEVLKKRLNQVDFLVEANKKNETDIQKIYQTLENTFEKKGLVKYDAFNEMGGKLSFSLAMLNKRDDGFIINAMHSRDGCYTYIKEIIGGNCVINLSDEEKEALDMAIKNK